jgi:outer membrane protein
MKRRFLAAIALTLFSANAQSQTSIDKGDWLIRTGATYFDPSSSGLIASFTFLDPSPPDPSSPDQITFNGKFTPDDDISVTFNLTYMFTRNLGLEFLAGLPFQHNIKLNGTVNVNGEITQLNDDTVGSTRQWPLTLSLQWHQPIGRIVPYVGLGVNRTIFYNERILGQDVLSLENSWGFAAQIGFDFLFGERWLINADFRYIGIETDVDVIGIQVGSVDVNPWTAGLSLGFKF